MALTRDDVEKVSLLARLQLTDDELNSMTEHLSQIIQYVHQLDEIKIYLGLLVSLLDQMFHESNYHHHQILVVHLCIFESQHIAFLELSFDRHYQLQTAHYFYL